MANSLYAYPSPIGAAFPPASTSNIEVEYNNSEGEAQNGKTITVTSSNPSVAVAQSGPWITAGFLGVSIPINFIGVGSGILTISSPFAPSQTIPFNVTQNASAPNWSIYLNSVDGANYNQSGFGLQVGQTRALIFKVTDNNSFLPNGQNTPAANHPVEIYSNVGNTKFTLSPLTGNTDANGFFSATMTGVQSGIGSTLFAKENVQNHTFGIAVDVYATPATIELNAAQSNTKIYPEFSDNGVLTVVVKDTAGSPMSGVVVTASVISGTVTLPATSATTAGSGNAASCFFGYQQSGSSVGYATIRFSANGIIFDQQVKIAKVTTMDVTPTILSSSSGGPVQFLGVVVRDNFNDYVVNRFAFGSQSSAAGVADVPVSWNTDGSGTGQIQVTFGTAGTANIELKTPTSAVLATVPVTVSAIVNPPLITSANSATAAIGQSFNFNPTATGSAPITWSIVGALPSWLSFNQAGAPTLFSAVAVPNNVAAETVTFQATNSAGTSTQIFTINKIVTGSPPVFTSASTVTGQVGQPFAHQLSASGTDPKQYSILGPSLGFTVSSSGLLTHPSLPAPAGTSTLQLQVENGIVSNGQQTLSIVKQSAPVAAQIISSLAIVDNDTSFIQFLTVTGNLQAVQVISPSWVQAGTNSNANSIEVIGQVPANVSATTPVVFALTNAAGTVQQTVNLPIRYTPSIVFVTANNWTGSHGQFNNFTHKAQGGVGAITYSLVGAPPEITIDPVTGVVTVSASLP